MADRTMSLPVAEGAETARSKARRGAAPLPLERLVRDARVLRITGGVDFAVDVWAAEAPFARADSADAAGFSPNVAMIDSDDLSFAPADIGELSPRNRDHLELADVFCMAARRRPADLRPDLQEAKGGDTGLIAGHWL